MKYGKMDSWIKRNRWKIATELIFDLKTKIEKNIFRLILNEILKYTILHLLPKLNLFQKKQDDVIYALIRRMAKQEMKRLV